MIALYTVWFNFVRIHKTLRVTPAMSAGIADKLLSMEDVVAICDRWESAQPKKRSAGSPSLPNQTETLPASADRSRAPC